MSTLNALMDGVYESDFTIGDLRTHGDLGVGTFEHADGEMVLVDGVVHRIAADGVAREVTDDVTTPFAVVTFFDADREVTVTDAPSCAVLGERLLAALPNPNGMYALRAEGLFTAIRTRSVPAQRKPYPLLRDVFVIQSAFEFQQQRGVMVGFWLPQYMNVLSAAGFHWHFITDDRLAGGHVLDCVAADVRVQVDDTPAFRMALQDTPGFRGWNSSAGE